MEFREEMLSMAKNISIDRPLDLLNNSKGKKVLVFMKGDRVISGTLITFDIHINLILDNAEDVTDEKHKAFGLIFIRGDIISFVSPSEE